jgi:hypothetical protein
VTAETRKQWRDLGFFYDRDDVRRRWRLVGSKQDLSRLASLLAARVAAASPRQSFRIGSEYAPSSGYDLEVEVTPDGFDPASADPNCVDRPSP